MLRTRLAARSADARLSEAKEAFRKAGWEWPSKRYVRNWKLLTDARAMSVFVHKSLGRAYAENPQRHRSFLIPREVSDRIFNAPPGSGKITTASLLDAKRKIKALPCKPRWSCMDEVDGLDGADMEDISLIHPRMKNTASSHAVGEGRIAAWPKHLPPVRRDHPFDVPDDCNSMAIGMGMPDKEERASMTPKDLAKSRDAWGRWFEQLYNNPMNH